VPHILHIIDCIIFFLRLCRNILGYKGNDLVEKKPKNKEIKDERNWGDNGMFRDIILTVRTRF
jgi:hypothetical protein